MYCIKCGVELEDGVKRCPLCETAVPEIKGLEEEFAREYPIVNINLYEMKMKKVKKAVFLSFFTISIIFSLDDISEAGSTIKSIPSSSKLEINISLS